jgi:hypothetical protein
MWRRTLAAFLVLSWFVLSGIDILEDLDLPFKVEFERSGETPGPGAKRAGLVHNIAEFAHSPKIGHTDIVKISTVGSGGDSPGVTTRSARLHKYHQIFLI